MRSKKHLKGLVSVLIIICFLVTNLTAVNSVGFTKENTMLNGKNDSVVAKELISVSDAVYDSVPDINEEELNENPQKRILVRYKNASSTEDIENLKNSVKKKLELKKMELKKQIKLGKKNIDVFEIDAEEDIEKVIQEINKNEKVEYAQEDYLLQSFEIPADNEFSKQWGLYNFGQSINEQVGINGVDIKALGAWKMTKGSEEVVVAVLDTGIDINHPDLVDNIFINHREIPNNGIDDDNNSLIDDVNGWDFSNYDNTVYDSSSSDRHGTHVAGTIAGKENKKGICGVAPNVKILPVKFINGTSGYTSQAIEGINYCKSMGVDIVNCSFGSSDNNLALKQAMEESGLLFVTAAGNTGVDTSYIKMYPACFDIPNKISVAAIDNRGYLASFSSFGKDIDVAAPGSSIYSTLPEGGYGFMSGTSMGAPMVTGIAGLLKSYEPDITVSEIINRIKNNVVVSDKLIGKLSSGGRVDAKAALMNVVPDPEDGSAPLPASGEKNIKDIIDAPKDNTLNGNSKVLKPLIIENNSINAVRKNNGPLTDNGLDTIRTDIDAQDISILSYIDEIEPNDTSSTGMPVGIGTVYGNILSRYNQDWYIVNFEANKQYTIRLTGLKNGDDLDLYLYDSTLYPLGYSDFIGSVDEEIIYTPTTSGSYYINASCFTYGSSGDHSYQLLIYPDDTAPDSHEPNDSLATATSIASGIDVSGNININTDEDWYVINATTTGKLVVTLDGIPTGCDYDLSIRNENDQVLGGSYFGSNTSEKANILINSPGNYYIRVYSYYGSDPLSNYSLKAVVCHPDLYEKNDYYYEAKSVNEGTILATIDNSKDEDWFKFDVNETGTYVFEVQNIPLGMDYDICLYDSYRNYIDASYLTENTNELISLPLNPGSYYAQIYSYRGYSDSQQYTFTVSKRSDLTPTSPQIGLELDKVNANVGDIITATLKVNNIQNFSGYQASIRYNPFVVQPINPSTGEPYSSSTQPQAGSIWDENFQTMSVASNDIYRGYLNFGRTYMYPDDYKISGNHKTTGDVAVISFKVLLDYSIDIGIVEDYTKVKLFDWDGNKIPDNYYIQQPKLVNPNSPKFVSLLDDVSMMVAEEYIGQIQTSNINTYTLTGKIKPDIGSYSVPNNFYQGFNVQVEGQTSVETGTDGAFRLFATAAPGQRVKLLISKTGYVTREVEVQADFLSTEGDNVLNDIYMWLGDCSLDSVIDIQDLNDVINHFNTVKGDTAYIDVCDFNKDDAINMIDIMLLIKHYNANKDSYSKHSTLESVMDIKLSENKTLNTLYIKDSTLDLNGFTLQVNGNVTFMNSKINLNGGELNVETEVGSVYVDGGDETAIDLKSGKMFVNKDFRIDTGSIEVNGGYLEVGGKFMLGSAGEIKMTNPNDYVRVMGDFLGESQKKYGGCYTAGLLELNGNFTLSGNNDNNQFVADGTHMVLLIKDNAEQVIDMFNGGAPNTFNIVLLSQYTQYVFKPEGSTFWKVLLDVDDLIKYLEENEDKNTPSGGYNKTFTDIISEAPGFEIVFSSKYSSMKDIEGKSGSFGSGWTFGLDSKLKSMDDTGNAYEVELPDGTLNIFVTQGDTTNEFTGVFTRSKITKVSTELFIMTTKDQYKYHYEGNETSGYTLTKMVDPVGNYINITKNGTDKIIEDITGRQYIVKYNNDGKIYEIEDQKAQRKVSYSYNLTSGRLESVTDPMMKRWDFTYDTVTGLLNTIKVNSSVYEEIVHENNKLKSVKDALGRIKEYSYEEGKTTITDKDSNNGNIALRQTIFEYDRSYTVHKRTVKDLYNGNQDEYSEVDYGAGKMNDEARSIVDIYGNRTTYQRDENGNVEVIINPDGSIKEFDYDENNNLIWEKDEEGNFTFYVYDGNRLVKKATRIEKVTTENRAEYPDVSTINEADYQITDYSYYPFSDLPDNNSTYKAYGLLESETIQIPDADIITRYNYHADGTIEWLKDPETGKNTQYEVMYDNNGWIKKVTSPDNHETHYYYNKNGQLVKSVSNANIIGEESITVIRYDEFGRKKQEISPNLCKKYGSNIPEDVGYRYSYEGVNNLVATVTDPENNTTQFKYDIFGNIIKEVKPNGAVYEYKYNALNRQTNVYFRKNEGAAQELLEKYDYSKEQVPGKNYFLLKKDHTKYFAGSDFATTVYKSDYAGRLVYQRNPDGGYVETVYYKNGKVKSVNDVKNANLKTHFKYDQYFTDGTNKYRYDEKWTPYKIDDNGVTKYIYTKITYNLAGRIKTEEVENDKDGVTYDEAANGGEGDGTRPVNFFTTTYSYYKNGKVQKIQTSDNKVIEYGYDGDGNLNSETVTVDSGKTIQTTYVNNYLGKPDSKTLKIRKGDLFGNDFDLDIDLVSVTTQYQYDKDGNLTSSTQPLGDAESVTTYCDYDNMNRLVRSKQTGTDEYGNTVDIIATTLYNWEGKPEYVTDANGNTAKYLYDERGFKAKEVMGSIVVGITDPGFSKTGVWNQTPVGGYRDGTSYYSTSQSNTAIWKPQISEEGDYKVFVRYPSTSLNTNSKYTITDNSATPKDVYIDQTVNADKWVYLGTYSFDKGDTGYVTLTSGSTKTLADAVMFEPVNGNTKAYYYDMAGRVTDEILPMDYIDGADNTAMNRTVYTYDTMGRLKTKGYKGKEKQVNTTTWTENDAQLDIVLKAFKYDLGGNVIKELDALGYESGSGTTVDEKIDSGYGTLYTYTPLNQVETVVDPENQAVSIQYSKKTLYDTRGRKVFDSTVKGYDSSSKYYAGTWYEYNDTERSMLVKVGADASNEQTAQKVKKEYYDYAGRLIKVEDGNSLNNASGKQTVYEYNEFNQIRSVTYPGDETIEQRKVCHQYDYSGTLKKQFESYKMKNTTGTEDDITKVVLYTYDNQERLIRQDQYDENDELNTKIYTQKRYDRNGNVRFSTDGRGNETEYIYDSLGRLEASIIKFTRNGEEIEHKTVTSYDKNNNIIENKKVVKDGIGNISSIIQKSSYDSLNRLYRKQDTEDNTIQWLEYYHNGLQKFSYDAPNGDNSTAFRKTEFQYDKNGRLLKTIDPTNTYDPQMAFNNTTSFVSHTYDYAGNVRTKSDGINTTQYIYDEFDRLYEVKNAVKNEKTRYLYDYCGNLSTQEVLEIEEVSSVYTSYRKKTYEYNVLNKISKAIVHWDRDAQYNYTQQKVQTYKYYVDGSIKEKTDRNGAVTTYIYDVHGRMKSQKVVKTGETSVEVAFDYDKDGNVTNVTNLDGGVVTDTILRQYDPLNRVISKSVTGIGEVTFKYDIIPDRIDIEQGLVAETSTDPKTNKTTKVYDRNGRLKYVINGEANTGTICATYEYYKNGSLQSLTYEGGAREVYTYWEDGQLKELVNSKPDGTEIDRYKYQYDASHNQIRKTDNKGTTIYTYDELNRLKTVSEPIGRNTEYDYDAAGNRKAETITVGTETTTKTYIYSELDWLTDIKVNDVLLTSYTYDDNGNMKEVYQNSNLSQTYTYDLLNRMIGVNAPDGSPIMSCKYNGEGFRVSKTSEGATTKYLYEYDKVVLEVDDTNAQKARNIYGTNLINRTVDGTTLYYMYNGHGDVTALYEVLPSAEIVKNISLTADCNVVNGKYATDGVVNTSEYTSIGSGLKWAQVDLGQPQTIEKIKLWRYFGDTRKYHDVIVQLSNDPDFPAEDTTTVFNNDTDNSASQGIGTDQEYTETSSGKEMVVDSVKARYIRIWSNGNTVSTNNHIVELEVYVDSALQLNNLAANKELTGSCSLTNGTYATDVNINTSQYTQLWSGLQWVQLDLGQSELIDRIKLWRYFYDTRQYHDVIVQLSNDPNFAAKETTTVFNNDADNSAQQGVGSDAEYTETNKGKEFAFAPVNARYIRIWSNGSTGSIHNHIVELEVYRSNIEATYYYDAFGNILESTGSVDNSITYAGYQYDKETEVRDANGNVVETGLYYLNSRMYDPKVARFLQEDTVKGDIKDPLSLNLYSYCWNEPIMYTDPTGETPIRDLVSRMQGSIYWHKETNIADVTLSGISYSFQMNSDNSISLIKDGLKYGTFDQSEARAISYTGSNGEDLRYIDIEDSVFGKYFVYYGGLIPKYEPGSEKQPYNTIFNPSTDNALSSSAKLHIWNLDNLYGNLLNAEVPQAEAQLTRDLDKVIRRQGNNGFGSLKDINYAISRIANNYSEYVKQSNNIGVPKEMIASVIFREIMTMDVFDLLDGNPIAEAADKGLTLGDSQISVGGTRQNDEAVPIEHQLTPTLTDGQIKDLLLYDEKSNVYFAAAALKFRAQQENFKIARTVQETYELFEKDKNQIIKQIRYYNEGQETKNKLSEDVKVGGMQLLFMRYNDSKEKRSYGIETYEYFLEFVDYYKILDRNRVR